MRLDTVKEDSVLVSPKSLLLHAFTGLLILAAERQKTGSIVGFKRSLNGCY